MKFDDIKEVNCYCCNNNLINQLKYNYLNVNYNYCDCKKSYLFSYNLKNKILNIRYVYCSTLLITATTYINNDSCHTIFSTYSSQNMKNIINNYSILNKCQIEVENYFNKIINIM